ncbi:MAG: aldehyde dehydrogenase family protein [Actinophytocola sp.]|nr:aldehyde dehydrogenase family protein [Actinophytocola sp.]
MTLTAIDFPRALFIGGEWADAEDGATIETIDPSTEEPIGVVPSASVGDVDRAVAAAGAAAQDWANTTWPERAELLRTLARRIEGVAEEIARLDTRDAGMPLAGSRGDVASTVRELEYFAGLGGEAKGVTLPGSPSQSAATHREPYGVVGRIIPFNHPFKFAASKCAAPLMAGNTVVLKPAEHTSLSALLFAELAEDVLPAGVLNVVPGPAATGAAIVGHPDVGRVAFTGSVPSGRAVLRAAAEHIKHVTLELGGKNPMVIFDDADPQRAAAAAVAGMNLRRSMGQSCQSNSRILVHRRIKDAFLTALAGLVAALRVGDPADEATDIGPLAFESHYRRVLGYIDSGVHAGARLLTGGGRPAGLSRGYFVEPTVFADVDPGMQIAREEIFGPVMAVLDWEDEDEAIRLANDVDYGLTANIWTNDLHRAHRTARRLQAGTVWINGEGRKPLGTPFGGYKHSGLGLEGSLDELLSYTRCKSVVVTVALG